MKKITALLFFIGIFLVHDAQVPAIVFYDGTVIDLTNGKLHEHQEVVVAGNRIIAVQPVSGKTKYKNTRVVDARGKYIIPGFWDMHVHVLVEEGYKWQFPLYIANGIIGLREMWGRDMRKIDSLRDEMQKGNLPYFHLMGPGHIIDGEKPYWSGQLAAPDTATAIRLVDSLIAAKVDFIKVYSSLKPDVFEAIARRCKQKNISFAGHVPHSVWVSRAAELGMSTMEHLYGFLIEACAYPDSAMKLKTINSNQSKGLSPKRRKEQARNSETFILDNFSVERMRAIAKILKQNNTSVVPTMVMNRGFYFANDTAFTNDERIQYLSPVTKAYWKETIEEEIKKNEDPDWQNARKRYELEKRILQVLAEEGVMIMAGTDADMPYAFPGFGLHDELAIYVEAGMKPIDALRTATINPVTYLKMTDSLGSIEKGKRADFLLLNENPLVNIKKVREISGVMRGGEFYDEEELERMKTKVIRENEKSR